VSRAPRWAPRALRGAALALVLLLLLNPAIPGSDPALARGEVPTHWVVLELHPSLAALLPEGAAGGPSAPRLLDQVGAEARARLAADPGAALALVDGGPVEAVSPGRLDGLGPEALTARDGDLPRALLRLVEAGAERITLLSPLRDASGTLGAFLGDLPVHLEVVEGGAVQVRNAGVAALELPDRSSPGVPVEGAVVVAGEGGTPGDTLEVVVEAGGVVRHRARIQLPEAGTRTRVPFTLPATVTGGGEGVEIEVRMDLEGDRFPFDDRVSRLLDGGGALPVLFLVSLAPDGEPRVLLPLLERSTGLRGEGWLRLAGDRFIELGGAGLALRTAPGSDLATRAREARLLVVQGPEPLPEPWAGVVAGHPRVLRLTGAGGIPGTVPDPRWRPDPELPSSPLSPFLAGVLPPGGGATLPPLALASPGPGGDGAGVPLRPALRVRAPAGSGAAGPLDAVLAGEEAVPGSEGGVARRVVVVAGSGYWRWPARGGAGPAFHRALFGGAAAWLLEGVGPEPAPSTGTGPSPTPASATFGELAPRALLAPPGDPPPGALAGSGEGPRGEEAALPGRPLRSHPLPWILVALLLCGAWVLRRRMGLR
jgi:hypothetical protein